LPFPPSLPQDCVLSVSVRSLRVQDLILDLVSFHSTS
jgi:hypothetical protein